MPGMNVGSDRGPDTASGSPGAGSPSSVFADALIQPRQREQLPPCAAGCACGADVRGWIAVVAQRRKLGLSDREAYSKAWNMVTAVNPFPATLGRICPHPCESGCNRGEKDGAIAINALERFLGDWAIRRKLPLARLDDKPKPESIGVIGAGPAGLSFAYQMARRGYRVTIYEKADKPGGMLYYGIPQYRLPENVLESEIRRILDLGVELKLGAAVGRDFEIKQLRQSHDILFLGIGAGKGLKLGISGEEGAGAWTGTEYLACINRGQSVALGDHALVVGGGNTAMDAARAARRNGSRVTVLYRRTREEMPAIASEVEDALAEGVRFEYLSAPVQIKRDDGSVCGVVVQRMSLAEPDASGRRRPVPIAGSEHEIAASSVVAAVSQEPDWEGLGELQSGARAVRAKTYGRLARDVWSGGDAVGLGIAGIAIAQGRQAAEAVHAQLRGLKTPGPPEGPAIPAKAIKADYYAANPRTALPHKSVDERLAKPELEVQETIDEQAFLGEVSRCFSCGDCFGCEHCFMYCSAGAYTKMEQVGPGAYFAFSLDCCMKCGTCIDVCPCGFLTSDSATIRPSETRLQNWGQCEVVK